MDDLLKEAEAAKSVMSMSRETTEKFAETVRDIFSS